MEPYGDYRDVTDEDRADAYDEALRTEQAAAAMAATADFGVVWGDDDIDSRGTLDRSRLLEALRDRGVGVETVDGCDGLYHVTRMPVAVWPSRKPVKDEVLELVREVLRARPLPLDPLQQGPGWLDDRARNLTMALTGSFDMTPVVIK